MNNIKENVRAVNYLYVDELDNVVYECGFTIVLGKIDLSYRFIPKSNVVVEQGLTPQMLSAINNLIKKKSGIGKSYPNLKEELESKKDKESEFYKKGKVKKIKK